MLTNRVLIRYETSQNLDAGEMVGGCVHSYTESRLLLKMNFFFCKIFFGMGEEYLC